MKNPEEEDLECFLVKNDLNIHALINEGVLWKVDKVKESKAEVLKVCPRLRAQCRTVTCEKFFIDIYRHQTRDDIIVDVNPKTLELYGEPDPKTLEFIKMTGQPVKFLIENKIFTRVCTKIVERKIKQQSYQRYKLKGSGMCFVLIFHIFDRE